MIVVMSLGNENVTYSNCIYTHTTDTDKQTARHTDRRQFFIGFSLLVGDQFAVAELTCVIIIGKSRNDNL